MRLEVSNRQTALKCRSADVRGILKRVLRAEGKDAQLSVALVDDQQMRRLNARFLGKDSTTDESTARVPVTRTGPTVLRSPG